jgi:hypothetical protein
VRHNYALFTGELSFSRWVLNGGGCFFGGNEMSDAGESLICVLGFYVMLIR